MKSPLISVIVPIYNVEQYIVRCIESIINQTYANLEIILVDDGSPDNCGVICDNFAKIDKRIKVIHKKNGGLSSARNVGLELAKGEYIGFVDGDDFIHEEMYERLYKDVVDYDVKLSFCQCNKCIDNIPEIKLEYNTKVVNKSELIPYCMEESIWFSANTKLYHHSLFYNLRFPDGLTNEDYPTTIQIYDKCERIAVNNNRMYNYIVRDGSICTSPLNIHKFDCIFTSEFVLNYMKEKHKSWVALAEVIYVINLIGLLGRILLEDTEKSFLNEKKNIIKRIKSIFFSAFLNKKLLLKYKVLLVAIYIHPTVFLFILKIINR